ncbi:MAG: DNA recombination protein RmuC [Propionibacteriaceae bacterium]|jgi:DNA recombination protein RmuC|nr:DNA recombination protein RmuC [Propionibacteriaceae bacterium]
MEYFGWVVAVVVAALAVVVLVLRKNQAESGAQAVANAELKVVEARLAEVAGERDSLREDLRLAARHSDEIKDELTKARVALAGAQVERDGVREQLAVVQASREDLIAEIGKSRQQLSEHFKSLSAQALKEQREQADKEAADRLQKTQDVMAPVRENLDKLQAKLGEVEIERAKSAAELREQVSTVKATGEVLRRETSALATALRKPQARGAWGELQLKRVVEAAGMKEHVDFSQQRAAQNADGKAIRPDLVVELGDGRFIFVDSKVPMQAFLDALERENEDERVQELSRVSKHLKAHIDNLSAKEYFTAEVGTPEFVVLFIAHESMAVEALSQDPDLHEYAFSKNIVLATPSSLVAMLKTVAFSWKQNDLAQNARAIAELGQELYKRLGTLGNHFIKLGSSLDKAVGAYNDAVASLEGRVLVQARKMHDLGIAGDELKEIPKVGGETRELRKNELVCAEIDEPLALEN